MQYDLGRVTIRKRDGLPHWDAQHAIYFVTFNLHDAVPMRILNRIRAEADARLAANCTASEKRAIEDWMHARISDELDQSHNSCVMRDPGIASIVASAITHFDGERYELLAWCVMPSHVHVVMSLLGERLDRVLHSWKSFTARQCNAALKREGAFWQDGYYDRCVRNSSELRATVEYVAMNPGKAGLCDWPFVRVYGDRLPR